MKNETIELSGFEVGIETFEMTTNKCSIESRWIYDEDTLIIKRVPKEKLYYSFAGLDGLCQTTQYGSVRSSNLLLAIASLDKSNKKKTARFFEEHGFLFPVPESGIQVRYSDFTNLLYRLEAITNISSELSKKDINPNALLLPTLYLLLGDKIEIKTENGEKTLYVSPEHPAIKTVNTSDIAINTDYDAEEAEQKGTYTVKDTFYENGYELDAETYDSIIQGEDFGGNNPALKDERYRKLASVYKTNHNLNKNTRRVIDFLFHYMLEVGVIESVGYSSDIKYYTEPNTADEKLLDAVPDISRIVLAYEVNAFLLSSVRPQLNPSTMEPSWKATSLYSALLFSLFHMKAGHTTFKRCANPSCHKYFSVSSSNGRKIYCGKKCRDAKNSREHRKNHPEERKKKTPQD